MYNSFFQFHTKPFELTPNPDFLYLSNSHKQAKNYLHYGLQEKAGFILLTGEVGLGKTTLLRDLIQRLERDTISATIFNTKAAPVELLSMINEEFGLNVGGGRDKVSLLRDLNDFLLDQYANAKQPILIVDEAQNLSMEALEELRLLSNLETQDAKLIHIVLSGQPELKNKLMQPELRQLRQRISVSCNLTPLTLDEMKDYIWFRLERAGNKNAVTMDEGVYPVLFSRSRGIPRVVNVLCDYLLLTAFSEETTHIDLKLVLEVADEIVPDVGDEPVVKSTTVPPSLSSHAVVKKEGEHLNQTTDPEFLAETNRRLVQLLSTFEERTDEVYGRFDWLERNIGEELKSIREHLKTLGGSIVRIGNRLDKL